MICGAWYGFAISACLISQALARAKKVRGGLAMPVLLLWAVPAVIIVGGAGYWLVHMH